MTEKLKKIQMIEYDGTIESARKFQSHQEDAFMYDIRTGILFSWDFRLPPGAVYEIEIDEENNVL